MPLQHIPGTCTHNIFTCANVVILSLLHVPGTWPLVEQVKLGLLGWLMQSEKKEDLPSQQITLNTRTRMELNASKVFRPALVCSKTFEFRGSKCDHLCKSYYAAHSSDGVWKFFRCICCGSISYLVQFLFSFVLYSLSFNNIHKTKEIKNWSEDKIVGVHRISP